MRIKQYNYLSNAECAEECRYIVVMSVQTAQIVAVMSQMGTSAGFCPGKPPGQNLQLEASTTTLKAEQSMLSR